jgi:tetratricopeptide (TPR) repeat protein
LSIYEKLSIKETEDVADSLSLLGAVRWSQRRFVDAESAYRQSLAIYRKLFGNENEHVANVLVNLGIALKYQGRSQEAEQPIRDALEIQRRLFGDTHPDVADSLRDLGRVLMDQRRWADAETALQDSLAMRRKLHGDGSPQVVSGLIHLATLYRAERNFAKAEAAYRECLAIFEKSPGYDPAHEPVRAELTCQLGRTLYAEGKYVQAEPYLLAGYAALKPLEDKSWRGAPILKNVMTDLVKLYEKTNRPEQVAEWRQKLADFAEQEQNK